MALTFLVRRDDLRRTRFATGAPTPPSGPGPRAVLRVERFALTSNNLFYASFGESLSFFNYFPVEDPAWACVPAWGYSTVESSELEGITPGERYFGYVPMATHFTVLPVKGNAGSFLDTAPNRPVSIPIYNTYRPSAVDPLHSLELEPALAVFRPIFTTSFVLADFLSDNDYFGAEQVVVSSASSKTAYGTAYALSRPRRPSVVGLTAPKNRAFVERLGVYDSVVAYPDAATLPVARTIYVDVASNPALRRTLRERLGENLVRDLRVGGSHWDSRAGNVGTGIDDGSSAAAPEQFLAATQIARRTADFGPAGFQGNVATALSAFLSRATAGETPWVRFVTASGEEAVSRAYDEVVSGRASPEEAYVLEM